MQTTDLFLSKFAILNRNLHNSCNLQHSAKNKKKNTHKINKTAKKKHFAVLHFLHIRHLNKSKCVHV